MNYKELKDILSDLGEKHIQIKNAYIMQVGCIALEHTYELQRRLFPECSNQKQLSKPKKDEYRFQDLNIDITEALKKHPNFFDINYLEEIPTLPFNFRIVDSGVLFQGKPFLLRVDLPSRLQRHILKIDSLEEAAIEKFNVISDGSIFVAYSEIQEYPVFPHFGNEYRDLVKMQIEKETKFVCVDFGPSPIHTHFYYAILKKTEKKNRQKQKVFSADKNIIIVEYDNKGTITEKVLDFLLFDITYKMKNFYAIMLRRSTLLEYHIKIGNNFNELSQSGEALTRTPWWRFIKSHKLLRSGKKSLTNIHIQFADFENELFKYHSERSDFLEDIQQNYFFQNISKYIENITKSVIQPPQTIFLSSLKYFQEELLTFSRIRTIILASLGGTILGAVLYAVFTHFFQ